MWGVKVGADTDAVSCIDQTPTPTRFLRIGEKIGLFQELEEATSNPFDQDFKSATTELKSSSQGTDDEEDGRSK